MRRFSGIWFLVVILKIAAVYYAANSIITHLSSVPNGNPTILFGQRVDLRDNAVASLIVMGQNSIFGAVLLWAIAELLRVASNAEAYSRALYTSLRRRRTEDRPEPRKPLVPIRRPDTTGDASAVRRRRWGDGSNYEDAPVIRRGAPVLRERIPSSVRPPRPTGDIDVIETVEAPPEQPLPFD